MKKNWSNPTVENLSIKKTKSAESCDRFTTASLLVEGQQLIAPYCACITCEGIQHPNGDPSDSMVDGVCIFKGLKPLNNCSA